ncbi:Spy/CpxP family protein refolding chaperone [Shewanella sp. VB17]|uniref:Spy/CpxP family protein refolding chaperone n=1 Tax=Shewanella sp. VB17 TaxID=2739432 RepID=UPI0015641DDF|nr:Spy/CpxP family protein refolding chaperone [Shewanella sp. VB17]NRD75692.1 Spy/CpxP family protein refolding chaperone [Shewanella sp. VB17]
MKKNTFKAGLLAIVASMALTAPAVYAGDDTYEQVCHMKHDRMGHHGDIRKMFKGLDLTDGQKLEIKGLIKNQMLSMKDNRPSHDERVEHKAKLLALISGEDFDEEQAKMLVVHRQQNQQSKAVAMLKVQNEVYQLLTAEQKEKFHQKFQKSRPDHREGEIEN